ncbi:MAG: YfhO family protein, partial [Dehalococcoidia bacterium]|nr:YfhO family protein [Dehalococcoidia bacterium]
QQDKDLFRVVSFNLEDDLTPNTAMLFGLQDARGYDSIILREYVDFWRLLEDPHGLLYNRIHKLTRPESLTSPLLDLLNVKYIITTQPLSLPGAPQHLREVYRGEVLIYENTDYLPRAFTVNVARAAGSRQEALDIMSKTSFDPRSAVVLETSEALSPATGVAGPLPAAITGYSANQVIVGLDGTQAGYLVLTDNYFAGWRASVDGQETPVYRADGTFRAVSLPPGARQVVFKYSPDSFNFGLLATLLAGLTLAMGTGYWGWRRLAVRLGNATTAQRVAKNISVPMAAQLLNRLLDFAFAIFMLRLLGPLNAGKYAFVVVLIGYFVVLTDFGLTTLTTREVAKSKSQANRYLSNSAILRILLTGLSLPIFAGILGLYAWRFDLTADTAWTGLLLMASLFPSGLASALSSVFSSYERMEFTAAVALIGNLIKLALGVLVLLL